MNESRNGANFGPPNDQNIKESQGFIRVFAIPGAEFDPGMSEYQGNARFYKGFLDFWSILGNFEHFCDFVEMTKSPDPSPERTCEKFSGDFGCERFFERFFENSGNNAFSQNTHLKTRRVGLFRFFKNHLIY